MRKFKIVTDSASDLLSIEGVELATAPMKIIAGEREFVDDESLDPHELIAYFDRHRGRSRTSCPNTADWLKAFGDADDVICVTITGGLSGSYNSACVAKQEYESAHEGRRVFVLDTLSAGPEMTLAVRRLAEYAERGMTFEEAVEAIGEYIRSTGLIFMLKSLKNFASNGRVSPLVAKLVGIAGICIVGRASDEGTLEPVHKCRGEARSLDTMIKELRAQGLVSGRVSIGHAANPEAAARFADMVRESFEGVRVEIHELRGLCSYYAERGGMLVGFEKG